MSIELVGFDGDDTFWHSEDYYQKVTPRVITIGSGAKSRTRSHAAAMVHNAFRELIRTDNR
ncbi:MAG: hypothetical protein ACYC7G_03245 [Rudaea sp.]